jgi:hypothetical protein
MQNEKPGPAAAVPEADQEPKSQPERSFREEFTLLWMRTGSDDVLRIHDCAQEELLTLARGMVEGGAARYATASRTTTEIVVEVDGLTERTTCTTTVTMVDWYVGEIAEHPPQAGGPQS